MSRNTSILISLLTLIPSLFALSIPRSISPRANFQTLYEQPGGDISVELGDGTINLGDQPPWYVLDKLNENCGQISCTDEFTYPTTIVHGLQRAVEHREILVKVDASYSSAVPLAALVESLKSVSAVGEMYTHRIDKSCERMCVGRACELGPCGGSDVVTASVYETSDRFAIRKEGDSLSFLTVHLSLKDVEGGAGFCSAITGAGSAIAGVLPGGGPASAGLGVLSVVCGLLE